MTIPAARDTSKFADSAMPPPLLLVEGLGHGHLGPVALTLAQGECLALQGPSGAGKSVLLRALVDLDPNQGRVSLAGTYRDATPAPEWRRRVAYLPAEAGWWTPLVRDHFTDPAAAMPLLDALGMSTESLGWPVARLSTGERQRLGLARCLLNNPEVLLLDEPTSALDSDNTSRVESLLQDRLAHGVGIILVTHDALQSKRIANRVVELRGGQLVTPDPSQP
jgi:phosphate-transporting ATPase